MSLLRFILPAVTLAALAGPAAAQAAGGMPAVAPTSAPAVSAPAVASAHSAEDAAVIASQKPSYPLKTCVVSGDVLGSKGAAVEIVRDGRLVELCSEDCVKGYDKAEADFSSKLDEAVIAAQKPGYPLKTCIVRGDQLTAAKTRDVVSGTRLIEVCCSTCRKKAMQNPQTYIDKIDAALIEQQSKDYPLTTCVVSGDKLDEPEKFLYGTTLVEFCCKDCKKEFAKDPASFVAQVEAARAAHRGEPGGAHAAPPAPPAAPAKNG